jgi:hypothetical protein
LVQTIAQVLTLVKPLFWLADGLTNLPRLVFEQLNPVYHSIDV